MTTLAEKSVEARGRTAKLFFQRKHGSYTGQTQRRSYFSNRTGAPNLNMTRDKSDIINPRNSLPIVKGRQCFICGSPEHLAAKCTRKTGNRTGVGQRTDDGRLRPGELKLYHTITLFQIKKNVPLPSIVFIFF